MTGVSAPGPEEVSGRLSDRPDFDRVAGQDPSAEGRAHLLVTPAPPTATGTRSASLRTASAFASRSVPSDTANTTSCGSTASTASWIVAKGVSCPR